MIDWSSVFDEASPAPGASDADIAHFVASIGLALSPIEITEINHSQHNPFPKGDPLYSAYRPFDPSLWSMPNGPLPAAYLAFLRWSNGGWCRKGEREFGWFPTNDPANGVRAMMLAYHIPEYMPGALALAFNGGGTFYLFDMRKEAVGGEYPIVSAHSGNLGWGPDSCWPIADSFDAVCRANVNVDDLHWHSKDAATLEPPERVDVYVVRIPKGGVRRLRSALNTLGLTIAVAELPAILKKIPYRICHNVPYLPAARLVAETGNDDACLGVFAVDRPDQRISLQPWEWH